MPQSGTPVSPSMLDRQSSPELHCLRLDCLFKYRILIIQGVSALAFAGVSMFLRYAFEWELADLAVVASFFWIMCFVAVSLIRGILIVSRTARIDEETIRRFRIEHGLPFDEARARTDMECLEEGFDWRGYRVTARITPRHERVRHMELEPLRGGRYDFRLRSCGTHSDLREGSYHAMPAVLDAFDTKSSELDAFFVERLATPLVVEKWNPTETARAVFDGADGSRWGPTFQRVFGHPFMLDGRPYPPSRRFGDSGPPAYSFRILRHRKWPLHIALSPAVLGVCVYPGVSASLAMELLPVLADVADAVYASVERAGNGGNDPLVDIGGYRLYWSDQSIDIDWPRPMPSRFLLASQRKHESMDQVLAAAWAPHSKRYDSHTRESVLIEARRDVLRMFTFETGEPELDELLPLRLLFPSPPLYWAPSKAELDVIRRLAARYLQGASPIASYLAISPRGVHITLGARSAEDIIQSDPTSLREFAETTHAVFTRGMREW